MKLKKYSWLAALPMILPACQEDTLVKENQQDDKIYTLSATMDGGVAMSRAQIQLGNENAGIGEAFIWNENDSFIMYQNIDNTWAKSTFAISGYSEDEAGNSATFTTDSPVTSGIEYTAFYPAEHLNNYGEFGAHVPDRIEFTDDKTSDEIWANYLKSWMLMEKKGTLTSSNNSVNFEHLCCLAKITYTNKTGKDLPLTRFYLEGNDWLFGVSYYHNVKTGDISYGAHGRDCGLNVYGLTVPADESVDLYLLFFPHEFGNNTTMKVCVEHQSGDWLKASLDLAKISEKNNGIKAFEAGKRYWFKVTETLKNGLEWTKEQTDKHVEVGTLEEFNTALNTYEVTHIDLTNPIIFTEDLSNLNIYLNDKIVALSDNFEWSVNGVEQNALFVNKNKYIRFNNGRIEAEEKVSDDKFLFSSIAEKGSIGFSKVDMEASGKMNGLKIDNASEFFLNGDKFSLFDVESGHAISITTSDQYPCSASIGYNGVINGDVYYSNNYAANTDSRSNFRVTSGVINGNFSQGANHPNDLDVEIRYDLNNNNVDSFVEALLSTFGAEFTVILCGNNETYLKNVSTVLKNCSSNDKRINLKLLNVYQLPMGLFECIGCLKSIEAQNVSEALEAAFWGCANLESVNLPQLSKISKQLFQNCASLIKVNVPQATSVGDAAFRFCKSLETLNLLRVNSIDAMSFIGCESLTSLVLGMPIVTFGSEQWAGWSIFDNSSNIDLMLSPWQKNMTIISNGYYKASTDDFWSEGETEKENKTFCGYTFKSIKKGE